MCMPNLSAILRLYGGVLRAESDKDNIEALVKPFSSIEASTETYEKTGDIVYCIGPFSIFTRFCFMGASKDKDENKPSYNILEKRGCLEVKIRLTKLDENCNQVGFSDLVDFEIDLNDEKNKIHVACSREFFNCSHESSFEKMQLPFDYGKYVVKVLVREKGNDEHKDIHFIQAIYPLEIGKGAD